MSSENSDSGPGMTLSLVAQFDDLNRLNSILNDGAAEECKIPILFSSFLLIMKACRMICKNIKQIFHQPPLSARNTVTYRQYFVLLHVITCSHSHFAEI